MNADRRDTGDYLLFGTRLERCPGSAGLDERPGTAIGREEEKINLKQLCLKCVKAAGGVDVSLRPLAEKSEKSDREENSTQVHRNRQDMALAEG